MTTLEKIARAICETTNPSSAYFDDAARLRHIEKLWKRYLPHARAALSTLLSPDEGMVEEAIYSANKAHQARGGREFIGTEPATAALTGAIKHILNENTSENNAIRHVLGEEG